DLVGRVTPCAPRFAFVRSAGRRLPALPQFVHPCPSVVKIHWRLPGPFYLIWRLKGFQPVQQFFRVLLHHDQLAVFWTDEPFARRVVEKFKKAPIKTRHIQQSECFPVIAELAPGEHFAKFLAGAVPAGQRNETVGEFGDQRLALVHVFNHAQVGQFFMHHFLDDERLRDHADDVAAVLKRGVRQNSHQPNATAAINQFDSALGQLASEVFRRFGIGGADALVRAAKDGNAFHFCSAWRTLAMNARILAGSFFPGADSTPLETSTPNGCTFRTAAATFSGVNPPARKTGLPNFCASTARSQLNFSPVPPRFSVEQASSSQASVGYFGSY